MTRQQAIREFLGQRTLAIAGASRNGKKFGNAVLVSLKAKGYRMLPVHPSADVLEGVPCSRSLRELPEVPGGLVVAVPPAETEKLVAEAHEAGITRIWMQSGAESPRAIALCEQYGITLIHGECILMFAEPAELFHRVHRFIYKLTGKYPGT